MNISKITYDRFTQIAQGLGIDPYHQPLSDEQQIKIVTHTAYAVQYIKDPCEAALLIVAAKAPRAVKVMQEDKVTKAVALKAVEKSDYPMALLPRQFRQDPDIQKRMLGFKRFKGLKRIVMSFACDEIKKKMDDDKVRINEVIKSIDQTVEGFKPQLDLLRSGSLYTLGVLFKGVNDISYDDRHGIPYTINMAWDVIGWRDANDMRKTPKTLTTEQLTTWVNDLSKQWTKLLVKQQIKEIE